MSNFRPLTECLDEQWDDPNKRKELRKAVFQRIEELEAENRIFRQTESVDDSVWDALLEQVRQHQATIERAKVHASETMRLLNWDQLGWDVPELVIEELSKALAALEGEKDE